MMIVDCDVMSVVGWLLFIVCCSMCAGYVVIVYNGSVTVMMWVMALTL